MFSVAIGEYLPRRTLGAQLVNHVQEPRRRHDRDGSVSRRRAAAQRKRSSTRRYPISCDGPTSRRPRRDGPTSPWVIGVLVVGFISGFSLGAWQVGVLSFSGLLIVVSGWIAFRVRTTCGVANIKGGFCKRSTRGILFGCRKDHFWEKIFAWSRYLGAAYIADKMHISLPALSAPSERPRDDVPSPRERETVTNHEACSHGKRDVAMFYLTIIQTLATIVGTIIAIQSLR